MSPNKLLTAAVLGASALFATQAAFATTVDASLADFGFKVSSLSSAAGNTPSIAFQDVFSETYANVDSPSNGFAYDFPATISATSNNVSGTDFLTTSMSPTQYLAHAEIKGAGNFAGYAQTQMNFVLSPHTQLVIYGTESGSGALSAGLTGSVYSYASMTLSVAGASAPGAQLAASNGSSAGSPFSQQFSLSYRNDTDQVFKGNIDMVAGVSISQAAMVPEPATYAMLLAGLLMVGAVARRRAS